MRCPFCSVEYDWKNIDDHLIVTRDAVNHIHVHGPMQNKEKLYDLIDTAIGEGEISDKFYTSPIKKEPPKEIVFHNRQAVGDIFVMTAGIRDFKRDYPNTRVGVITTARHIWDHNPNVDLDFRDEDKILKVGPGFLTNKSNRWNFHHCNSFRLDIEQKLGISIQQGETRPDLWMSEEEYNREPIIKGPYWIIIIGGEPGWTAKMYPADRWQEVVNSLPEIQFVQLGVKSHPYPHLENVIDFVGKTEDGKMGIRDLLNIFLHAQGSLGLVSMHMHVTAAFGNACCVVAGAREPSWFTQYYGHQYLQTNGLTECAKEKACWHCDVGICKQATNRVPKCVDLITPDDIVRAIRRYYDGGRLKYGEKIPNTFFKNVVKEKRKPRKCTVTGQDDFDSLEGFAWCTDELDKSGLDFVAKFCKRAKTSILKEDWELVKRIITSCNIKTILEFGPGISTLLFSKYVDKITSFDHDPDFISILTKYVGYNVELRVWDKVDISPGVLDGKYDLAFVDGPPAWGENVDGRKFSTKYASKYADIVIQHDGGRKGEQAQAERYLKPDFDLMENTKYTYVWRRKGLNFTIACNPVYEDKKMRMITTCRGYGGSERSSLHIMRQFLKKGFKVELYPTGDISYEYMKNIPERVNVKQWEDLRDNDSSCDILVFYTSDQVFGFGKPRFMEVMPSAILKANRKIMILNFQLGGAGKVEWTKNWDKYLFLNSSKEHEFLQRHPGVRTVALPPPMDIEPFLKVNPTFDGVLRLVRVSSQGDIKFPPNTNEMIEQILSMRPDTHFYFMPGPSFLMKHPQVHKHEKNVPSVPEFLSQGNLFVYSLPENYEDQGPRVVMEAQAAGISVIADNRWGAKERIISGKTGWLCNDFGDYLHVIKNLSKDLHELKEMGNAAREYAKKKYKPERWFKEIVGEKNE